MHDEQLPVRAYVELRNQELLQNMIGGPTRLLSVAQDLFRVPKNGIGRDGEYFQVITLKSRLELQLISKLGKDLSSKFCSIVYNYYLFTLNEFKPFIATKTRADSLNILFIS